VTLDWDGDGNSDIMPQGGDIDGSKHYEVDLTQEQLQQYKGDFWTFNVDGDGIKVLISGTNSEFHEATIEYTIGLTLTFEQGADVTFDETDYKVDASPWRFGEPSSGYNGDGTLTLEKNVFMISDVENKESFIEEHGGSIAIGMILFLIGVICGIFLLFTRMGKEKEEGEEGEEDGNGEGEINYRGGKSEGGNDPTGNDLSEVDPIDPENVEWEMGKD